MNAIGKQTWVIADGYIPEYGTGHEPEFTSHEAACILNCSDEDARVEITLFFEDKEPVGPYVVTVPARRTVHQRFNDLKDPEPVPRGRGYSAVIFSSLPVVVQQTRLDSRQAANALTTTIAYSA